jgi:hypothetical protein
MALPTSLSAMMTDLFAQRPTVATIREEDEWCPTATCFELEHWPSSKSSIISTSPSIEHQEHHNNDDYDLYSSRIHEPKDDQDDTLVTRRKCALENPKTIPSPLTSPTRPIRRANSFDSVQSSSSSSSTTSINSIHSYDSITRRGITTGSSFDEAWTEEPARRLGGGNKRSKRARTKKRWDSDEASELCWREYWG